MPLPNSSLQESRVVHYWDAGRSHRGHNGGDRDADHMRVTLKAKDIYLGGLAWPYFSDTGRDTKFVNVVHHDAVDAPGYSVFCVGLSIVAIALILTWLANYQFQLELVDKESQENADNLYGKSIRKYCEIVGCWRVFSIWTTGACVLQYYELSCCPQVCGLLVLRARGHRVGAQCTSYCMPESEDSPSTKNVFNPWTCRSRALSAHSTSNWSSRRCSGSGSFSTSRSVWPWSTNSSDSALKMYVHEPKLLRWSWYKYGRVGLNMAVSAADNAHGLNQMRSASQLACILTLVGYSMSFLSHNSESLQDDAV
ncbi:hypothetical protein GQ600_2347 [Phytophthora cactorum]|nr:hypothetical protein GQ600_2347 [Phytophthora cactorum]